MNYLNKIFLSLLFMGLVTSCSEGLDDNFSDDIIAVKANVASYSKSPVLDENGSGYFAVGDELNINASTGELSSVVNYTLGTTELKWSGLFHSSAEFSSAYFSANYPQLESENMKAVFDVSSVANPDLLLAEKVMLDRNSDNSLNLNFRHAMHKLCVTYVAEGGAVDQLNAIETVCTALTACSVDVREGVVAETDVNSRRSLKPVIGSDVCFIIPPQGVEYVTLTITAFGNRYEKSLSKLVSDSGISVTELLSGRRLNLKLKISDSEIVVDNSQISGWEDQGSVEGDLIPNDGFVLSFNGNGAPGEMASIIAKPGEMVTLPDCRFEYEYAAFRGWGKTYDDLYPVASGSSFLMPDKDVELYARWVIDLTQGGATPEFANTVQWVKGITPPKESDWEPILGLGDEYKSVVWKKEYGWYDIYQGHWNLCWAATASNIIHWWLDQNKEYIAKYSKGYNGPSVYDGSIQSSEIFKYFSERWPDAGNQATAGFSWFIAGTSEQYKGGGFFKDVFYGKDIYTKKAVDSRRVWNEVFRDAFQNGKGLSYITPDISGTHQCTIWGVGYDSEGFANCIYYTNSNDGRSYTASGMTGLKKLEFAGYENGNGAPLIESSVPGRYFTLISVESYSLGQDIWEEYFRNL